MIIHYCKISIAFCVFKDSKLDIISNVGAFLIIDIAKNNYYEGQFKKN